MTNLHQGYGFVEFRSEEDADYVSTVVTMLLIFFFLILKNEIFHVGLKGCVIVLLILPSFLQAIKVLNMIKLYGKPIRVNKVTHLYVQMKIISRKYFVFVCILYLFSSKTLSSISTSGLSR